MSKHRKTRGFDQFMQPPMFNQGNMPPNMGPPNMNMGQNMNPGMNMPPNMNMGQNVNPGMNMPPNMNMGQNMNQGMNVPPNMNMGSQGMGNGFNMNNPLQTLLGAMTGMGNNNGNGGMPMPGNMNNPLMDMLKNVDMNQFGNLFNALKTNGVNLNNVNTNGIDFDNQGEKNVSDDSTIQLLTSLKPFLPPKGIQAIDKVIELYMNDDIEE